MSTVEDQKLREKWDLVVNGSPAMRKAICEREPMLFAMYFFSEYFKFKTPPFHLDYYQDCKDLASGKIREALWCAFRFAGKSSIAKIAFVIWLIVYKKKLFIGWDSQDGDNAEAALFDITVALQTNERLLADFGHLYYKKRVKDALLEAKMKRIKSFITENGVKVMTFSTQQPIRGQLQGSERLGCMIFDDFETNETKDSQVKTQAIINHINEYRSGMTAGACALYLCNFITDSGSVAYLIETLKSNPGGIVRFTPVIDGRGVLAWPEKFTKTDQDAYEFNKNIEDSKLHKLSLESQRKSLSKDGLLFETEFMLNPSKSGDLYFDRNKVLEAIARAKEPIETNAGMQIWSKFNPKHRFGMGLDTAEGIGADSNSSAIIDLDSKPAVLAATFEDNQMSSHIFGHEVYREASLYGFPYLVPELNQSGYATIAILIDKQYPYMYQREVRNKTTGRLQKEYGWKANTGTKWEVLGDFKEAFEEGEVVIYDKGLLEEMKFFTKAEVRLTNRQKGATRHYDKLRAVALAWHARRYATITVQDRTKLFRVPGQDEPYRL